VILVEFLGFGGGAGDEDKPRQQDQRKGDRDQQSYDPGGLVRVLANGEFSDEQIKDLTEEEKARLREAVQNGR
jgi:hypothetical protein